MDRRSPGGIECALVRVGYRNGYGSVAAVGKRLIENRTVIVEPRDGNQDVLRHGSDGFGKVTGTFSPHFLLSSLFSFLLFCSTLFLYILTKPVYNVLK